MEELEVRSSKETSDLHAQRSTHEADTGMVLYAVHDQFRTVVVSSQDTNVLLLLFAHFERAQCEHLWMMSDTSKKRRYIGLPVNVVYDKLEKGLFTTLLPFHALTIHVRDTTS